MRVVTFQSEEVLNIILNEGIYFANSSMCREKNDYSEDILALNGKTPIWIFANPDISFDTLKSGELLEIWRCEMSLDQKIGLTQFKMLELEIDENNTLIKVGKTHNSYKYACVIDSIKKSQLCAVYHIENTNHFFYKKIVFEQSFNDAKNIITDNCIDTRSLQYYGIYDNVVYNSKHKRCSYCEANTKHLINNIPICSEFCKDSIIQLCKDIGSSLFNKLSDEDIINLINYKTIKYLRFGDKENAIKSIYKV